MSITPGQCRAARGLLDLSQSKLAEASHVGPASLSEFERGDRVPSYNNLRAIQAALEAAGIVFVFGKGDGVGVRLRRPTSPGAQGDVGLSPDLCRGARYLVNLSQLDLAAAAGLGRSTIAEFESGARVPTASNLSAIRATLETAGVAFVAADGIAGPGVRLLK